MSTVASHVDRSLQTNVGSQDMEAREPLSLRTTSLDHDHEGEAIQARANNRQTVIYSPMEDPDRYNTALLLNGKVVPSAAANPRVLKGNGVGPVTTSSGEFGKHVLSPSDGIAGMSSLSGADQVEHRIQLDAARSNFLRGTLRL